MNEPAASDPTERARWETGLFWALLVSLLAFYLVPIWANDYLPMLDLPVHYGIAATFHNYHSPHSVVSRYYESRGHFSPYFFFYTVCHVLSYVFSITVVMKIMLSATALGLVGAALYLLRSLKRSDWLIFFALPLLYDVNATYGYVSYRFSVVFLVASIGALHLEIGQPRARRSVLLAALALATYFSHAYGFAILGFLWFFYTVLCSPSLKRALRVTLSLAPAVLCAAPWYLATMWGKGPTGSWRVELMPLVKLMELIPFRLLNSFTGDRDEIVFLGLCLLWVVLVSVSPRPAARRGLRDMLSAYALEICVLLLFVAYFAVPTTLISPLHQVYRVSYRFLLPLCLLAIAVPRIELRASRLLVILPAVLLSGWYGVIVHGEYRGFSARYQSFDRVIDAIPAGKRVLAYSYQTWDRAYTVPMLGHFVGYYCARKDGLTSIDHTFAAFPYTPLKLRQPEQHPDPPPAPAALPMGVFGPRYDYYLIGDPDRTRRAPFDLRGMRLLVDAGAWRVYEKAR
jgi:hypothetical protein